MERLDAVTAARDLVDGRFQDALQAWLAGSVAAGCATATSDLDIVVLLDYGQVHRDSLEHGGWPVDLFVHTASSVRYFVDKDRERRHPSLARMVATGIPLLPGEHGAELREECVADLAAGPGPLPAAELDWARYRITDLLDDLAGGPEGAAHAAVVLDVWRETAELLLAGAEWWSGEGKWLARELQACDLRRGTSYAERLHEALTPALAGATGLLVETADEALAGVGGRLWVGYRADAELPPEV